MYTYLQSKAFIEKKKKEEKKEKEKQLWTPFYTIRLVSLSIYKYVIDIERKEARELILLLLLAFQNSFLAV